MIIRKLNLKVICRLGTFLGIYWFYSFSFISICEANEIFTASQLQPVQAHKLSLVRLVDGKRKAPTAHEFKVNNGTYILRLNGVRQSVVKRNEAGDLKVVSQDIFQDRNHFVYDKPLTWVPATIQKGQRIKEMGKIHWYRYEDGRKKRLRTGTYTHSIHCLGRKRVRLNGRNYDVVRLEPVTEARFKTVSMSINASCDYLPGKGIIQQHMDVKATFLKFFTFNETETLRWKPR